MGLQGKFGQRSVEDNIEIEKEIPQDSHPDLVKLG
jgi:hypothetical protein